MTWRVKKGFLTHTVYDSGRSEAARIVLKRGGYSVENAMKESILSISESSPLRLTIGGNAGSGTADIRLAKADSLVRPPRAEQLSLQWDHGAFMIKQTEHRDFQIFRSGTQIGGITGMLKRTALIELPDDGTPELAALLFALSYRMLREDDVDIV